MIFFGDALDVVPGEWNVPLSVYDIYDGLGHSRQVPDPMTQQQAQVVLRTAAAFCLPIAFCLFYIDKTQNIGWYTNADALYFPRLIEDAIQRPWELKGWVLPGDPDFFPSIPIYLFSYFITFNFRAAQIVSAVIQTCLFFAIGFLLYRRCRPNGQPLIFSFCLLTVLLFLVNVDRGYPAPLLGWIFEIFLLNDHFGSLMGSLFCLYFVDRALRDDSHWPCIIVLLGSVLFGISDYFFLLIFTAPMTLILAWLWLTSDGKRRCLMSLLATVVGGALCYLIGRLINHTVNAYLRPFDPSRMGPSWHALLAVFWNGGPEPLGFVILTVNLALALYAAIIMHRTWVRARPMPLNETSFLNILILNSIGATFAVSTAVVVFGIFIDVWTLRYFNCVVFMPALVVASLMATQVENVLARLNAGRREPILSAWAALMIAASAAMVMSIRIDLKPPDQSLLACLNNEHATAGMAEYWTASPLIMFSNWKYQVVQITGDGGPYYWITNREWIDHDWSDPRRPPRYSFIVMKDFSENLIAGRYGQPDRILACDGTNIWFYKNSQQLTSRLLGGR